MTNNELLIFIIDLLNQKYQIDVELNVNNGIHQLLPSIHKKRGTSTVEIRYNPSIFICFFLCESKDSHLLYKYLILQKYALYNRYDKCALWINKCSKNLTRRKFKSIFKSSRYNNCELEYKFYEIIFVVLHEFSHALFYLNPDIKNNYFDRIKSILLELTKICDISDVENAVLSEMPWFSRPFLSAKFDFGEIKRTNDSFLKLINNESRLEELACDMHACDIIQQMIENAPFSEEERSYIYRHCVNSLYYSEFLNTVDECITGKIDMKTAEDKSFFDSTRYSILTHHITMILEGREKGLGLSFDHFPIVNKTLIKRYWKLLQEYILQTTDLHDGALFPNEVKTEKCFNSICNLENSIMELYVK